MIGIDLQGHGRTLPFDRPMTFEHRHLGIRVATLDKQRRIQSAGTAADNHDVHLKSRSIMRERVRRIASHIKEKPSTRAAGRAIAGLALTLVRRSAARYDPYDEAWATHVIARGLHRHQERDVIVHGTYQAWRAVSARARRAASNWTGVQP